MKVKGVFSCKHMSVISYWYLVILLLVIAGCSTLGDVKPVPEEVLEHTLKSKEYDFLEGTDDVPLYPGFKPYGNNIKLYHTAYGAVVDAIYFMLDVEALRVERFYALTMLYLGWKRRADSTYVKKDRILYMYMFEENGGLIINFSITPYQNDTVEMIR